MPLKPDQAAYLAGIIDGEGCVRITRIKGVPTIRVHVTNTDPRIVQRLREWCGGYVWTESKAYAPNAKIRYVWEVSARSAAAFLNDVLPYLLLKREQAEIAVALQATKRFQNRVSPAVVVEREALVARLKILNRKGAA